MPFTGREYAEMHFIYGFCNGNALRAAREYRERYPNREHYPDYRVFIRVHNAYLQGRIPGAPIRIGRPRHDDAVEAVLQEIEGNPLISVRRIAQNLGIPRASVHRILRRNRMHPFHFQRVQALLPADFPLRVQFCEEILQKVRQDPDFFKNILWTDECCFRRAGIINIHNLHFWAVENPHLMRADRFQHQFSINLWCGILNRRLIGPFELPARLNGRQFLRFLRHNLPALLEEIPIAIRMRMWLQLDGAPPHFARVVRRFINRTYPNRWIGRGGTIRWPPRSPDLNPLDFFLWGYFKEEVYAVEMNNEHQLRQRIADVADQIRHNEGALRRLEYNFIRRCRLCITVGGRNFEHLL